MRRLKRTLLTGLLVAAMATTTYAGTSDINVTVDGQAVTFTDATPFVDSNGRTMMPVAKIGELLKVAVSWNPTTQTVTLKGNGKEVSVKLNDENITANGVTTKMDTKAVSVNGRTYVPMSAIAKAFGVTTSWDKATNTVSLKSATKDSGTTNGSETSNGSENTKDVEANNNTFTAVLETSPKNITESLNFKAYSSQAVVVYTVIGKSEYFEANDFTTKELKEEVDGVFHTERGVFNTVDFYGMNSVVPNTITTISMGIPKNQQNNEEYTAKIFGITRDGQETEVVDIKFTPNVAPKVITPIEDIVTNESITIDVSLAPEPVDIVDTVAFKASASVPVKYYFIIGESETLEAKNYTVAELKNILDNANKSGGSGIFETGELYGMGSSDYINRTTTSFTVPETQRIEQEYIAKIFGITEDGQATRVVDVEFTPTVADQEPVITATLEGISHQILFQVNSNVSVNYYFIVGESKEFENYDTLELKEFIENIQKNQYGNFKTDKFFGSNNGGMSKEYKKGLPIPDNINSGAEYTAKIFGVTYSGELTDVSSFEFVLE